jgi:hypothetical protein
LWFYQSLTLQMLVTSDLHPDCPVKNGPMRRWCENMIAAIKGSAAVACVSAVTCLATGFPSSL